MNFDPLAPFYGAMEFLAAGGKLQRCRLEFLDEIPKPRQVLLAGEGHGRFLPECVRRFPEARIVVVDSSERMLGIARDKVEPERVEFIHADLLNWLGPPQRFDLIVTNFFLDCFPPDELAVVVGRLGEMAAPDANWLLADFEIPTRTLARLRSRIIVTILYGFFRIACGLKADSLVSPDAILQKAGFSKQRRMTSEWGLLKSEWWGRA